MFTGAVGDKTDWVLEELLNWIEFLQRDEEGEVVVGRY